MVLASVLFRPYRTPPRFVANAEGGFDETMTFTPGLIAEIRRAIAEDSRLRTQGNV